MAAKQKKKFIQTGVFKDWITYTKWWMLKKIRVKLKIITKLLTSHFNSRWTAEKYKLLTGHW